MRTENALPSSTPGLRRIQPAGSRVTCNPAPTDTDRDWLVLVDGARWEEFYETLELTGWKVGGSKIPNDINDAAPEQRFNSFTLGEDNVIATCSEEFYKRFAAATTVAARLNLLDKEDRVALFQAVLYGAPCTSKDTDPLAFLN